MTERRRENRVIYVKRTRCAGREKRSHGRRTMSLTLVSLGENTRREDQTAQDGTRVMARRRSRITGRGGR